MKTAQFDDFIFTSLIYHICIEKVCYIESPIRFTKAVYLEIIGLCTYLCPMNFELCLSHFNLVCQTQKKNHEMTIFQLYVFL